MVDICSFPPARTETARTAAFWGRCGTACVCGLAHQRPVRARLAIRSAVPHSLADCPSEFGGACRFLSAGVRAPPCGHRRPVGADNHALFGVVGLPDASTSTMQAHAQRRGPLFEPSVTKHL